MVYPIVFKKRFQNKLEKLLVYIEQEFGLLVAQKFADHLHEKLTTLQRYPSIGQQSLSHEKVRSLLIGNHNRLYYTTVSKKIIVLNIYDTRINPKRNKLK